MSTEDRIYYHRYIARFCRVFFWMYLLALPISIAASWRSGLWTYTSCSIGWTLLYGFGHDHHREKLQHYLWVNSLLKGLTLPARNWFHLSTTPSKEL